nr:prepilin peptidase [Schaalia sp. 19OD2882]
MILDIIRAHLNARDETELLAGFVTWMVVGWWTWRVGWRIQRRYLIEAGLTPMRRTFLWWLVVIPGFLVVLVAQQRPASPAVVTVAMIGILQAIVDARTHRLPDAYTRMMGLGVLSGLVLAAAMNSSPGWTLVRAAIGAMVWFVPLYIVHRLPGGLGRGDVKLAPVLGGLVGVVGVDAALGGLVLSFVAAGLAALWTIVVGSAGTESRIPMGPWLIGGALAAHMLWGVVPDWL